MIKRCMVLLVAWMASLPLQAADFSGYSGEDLYKRFCAACHGPRGEGDGSVAAYFIRSYIYKLIN